MGHLGLVMPPADYAVRNGGIAYVASPNNPGLYDVTIANKAGSVHEAEERRNINSNSITVSLSRRCKMSSRTCSVKLCHNGD
eukprot:8247730-Ditylum_brightwellii.AAC.2